MEKMTITMYIIIINKQKNIAPTQSIPAVFIELLPSKHLLSRFSSIQKQHFVFSSFPSKVNDTTSKITKHREAHSNVIKISLMSCSSKFLNLFDDSIKYSFV